MARLLFETQAVRTRRGPLATGTEFVVYSDTAGTVLADISATVGGSAIAGSTVTVADIPGLGPSALQFYGPTDDTDVLYLRCPSDASLGVQEIEADASGGGGGGAHPNLAVHDALGLATDAELAAINTVLPRDLSAPAAWYAADRITGLSDGAAVATWSDLSGNGRHLTQATAGSRPTFQTGEQNGLPVVRFDGTDDWLRCAAVTWGTALAQPNTVFVVASGIVAGTDVLMDGPGGGAGRHLIYNGGPTSLSFFAGSQVDVTVTFPLGMTLLAWTVDGASSAIRKNVVAAASGNVGAQGLGGLTLGADQGAASPLQGDIAEVLIFDSALAAYEIQRVEEYLADKWAVSGRYARKIAVTDHGLWVSPSGSNNNDGLSAGSAKATVQAAVTAMAATGGEITVLNGTYAQTAEIVLPDTVPYTIQAGGHPYNPSVTLSWAADLGAGTHAFRRQNAGGQHPLILRGIGFQGPGAGAIGDAAPACDMRGILVQSRAIIERCNVKWFHSGLQVIGDHITIRDCSLGNWYNIYFADQVSGGDLLFDAVDAAGAYRASYAIEAAGQIVGATFLRGHSGFAPYSILAETPTTDSLIASVDFIDHAFEYVGNSVIYDSSNVLRVSNLNMRSCGAFSRDDANKLASAAVAAPFSVGVASDWTFEGCNTPGVGAGGDTWGTAPAELLVADQIDDVVWRGFSSRELVDTAVSLGIPLVKAKSITERGMTITSARERYIVVKAQAAVTAKQVVGSHRISYVVPYASRAAGSSSRLVAGVAMESAPTDTNTIQNAAVVAVRGCSLVKVDATAAISDLELVEVDPADLSKVREWVSADQNHPLGWAQETIGGAGELRIAVNPSFGYDI